MDRPMAEAWTYGARYKSTPTFFQGAGSTSAACAFQFPDTILQSLLSKNSWFCRMVFLFLWENDRVLHKENHF